MSIVGMDEVKLASWNCKPRQRNSTLLGVSENAFSARQPTDTDIALLSGL
jgi:hypothetical protein